MVLIATKFHCDQIALRPNCLATKLHCDQIVLRPICIATKLACDQLFASNWPDTKYLMSQHNLINGENNEYSEHVFINFVNYLPILILIQVKDWS